MRQCKRRRVFVVGASNSGKTPFARQVADALGVPLVSASAWFRKNFPPQGSMSRQEHTDAITRFNNEVLRQDPDFNLRYLRDSHRIGESCVVEGFRNPRDFAIEFDPLCDRVVLLRCKETEIVPTVFDAGTQVIESYLAYLTSIGMISPDQVWQATMERFADIESAVGAFLLSLGVIPKPSEPSP